MVCDVCRHDAPYTRSQLARRQQELDRNPTIDVYPCPECGGRDYMLSTVNLDAEPPRQYDGILSNKPPTGTAEAMVAAFKRQPRGPSRLRMYKERRLLRRTLWQWIKRQWGWT